MPPNVFLAESCEEAMAYQQTVDFLNRYTDVVELVARDARVAVCPSWQGRVMTSTCGGATSDGKGGSDFGFINRPFIEAGEPDLRMNNYGGEERLWLSPEGGPFSLWFKPGDQQTLDNWYTPAALNEGAWQVAEQDDAQCRMTARMTLQNASAGQFDLAVERNVRLLAADDLKRLFGSSVADVRDSNARTVAYETINRITNRGDTLTQEKGLVSVWILGMMNAGQQTVVVVPYQSGEDSTLGPVVKSDYFGPVPSERLKTTPEAVLFAADGRFRSKIGTSQHRGRNVLGSIDFAAGVLTLVSFTMPEDPAKHLYMNNMWGLPQPAPYTGDVANAYNDGPNESGAQLGAFYEIESLSPAVELATGATLEHRHRTVHLQADSATLDRLAKEVLGVELAVVRNEMLSE